MGTHTWFYDGVEDLCGTYHDVFRIKPRKADLPEITSMKALLNLVDTYKVRLDDEQLRILNNFFKEYDEPTITFG